MIVYSRWVSVRKTSPLLVRLRDWVGWRLANFVCRKRQYTRPNSQNTGTRLYKENIGSFLWAPNKYIRRYFHSRTITQIHPYLSARGET